MSKYLSICCGLALLLTTTACNSQSNETATPATPAAPAEQQATTPAEPAAQAAPATKKGKVLETMDASGYTYMHVDEGDTKEWVAIPQSKIEKDQEVSFYDGIVMENFQSKSLNRTFEKIIFSNGLVGQEGAAPAAAAPAAATEGAASFNEALKAEGAAGAPGATAGAPQAMGSQKAVVPFAEIKVDKASGANSYTVGELFQKATDLNGKSIRIKGKVVKVSTKIMGLNWLHIQDGSGDPAQNTHDLVVTTAAEPAADWDIVTVEGTLTANKDFGSGYSYKVLIEGATVTK